MRGGGRGGLSDPEGMDSFMSAGFTMAKDGGVTATGRTTAVERLKHLSTQPASAAQPFLPFFSQGMPCVQQSGCVREVPD
jgi:hypothetical protein